MEPRNFFAKAQAGKLTVFKPESDHNLAEGILSFCLYGSKPIKKSMLAVSFLLSFH
jgi:hypothetical protein